MPLAQSALDGPVADQAVQAQPNRPLGCEFRAVCAVEYTHPSAISAVDPSPTLRIW